MSDTDDLDEIEQKIQRLKNSARPPDYSARINALYIARDKAQERAFRKSVALRAKRDGGGG